MSVLEMAVILVFIVPIVGLCIGFVLCVGLMQMEETSSVAAPVMQEAKAQDQQIISQYRAYAAQVSNRRYVRPAGAMIRAAH